ncbi:MAG TPA: DUF2905 domain-containing protein [Anaerolineae bacterium]|nr:DUF2905 domain-containing protein [Anaerolineae bacterium]
MPDLSTIGRWLLIFGVIVAAAGGLLWLADRLGLPLGRLPGDIRIEREGFSCFVPLASSILISVLLTLAINLIARWFSR